MTRPRRALSLASPLVASLAVLLAAAPTRAQGPERIELVNRAGSPLMTVHLAAPDAADWGYDLIEGDGPIAADARRAVPPPRGLGCRADLKARLADGTVLERRLDLCRAPVVVLARPEPKGPPAEAEATRLRGDATGAGFVVDAEGSVATALHVALDCRLLSVRAPDGREAAAYVRAREPARDLALLTTRLTGAPPLPLRAGRPRIGEAVAALGYPLPGLLAGGPAVATGVVAAAAGLRGDPEQLWVSAPVQQGNSGGPVLDAGGAVVGLVVGKLDALTVAAETGDIPQNVNFALGADVLAAFLRRAGAEPRLESPRRAYDPADLAELARPSVVQVLCRR